MRRIEIGCNYSYWTMMGLPRFVDMGAERLRVVLTVWLSRSRIALYVVPA